MKYKDSLYLDRFQKLNKELGSEFALRGSTLLIEPLQEEEEKTAGGLYIGKDEMHKLGSVEFAKSHVGVVLATGQGYYNPDSDDYTPCDFKIGQYVLFKKESAVEMSTFPGLGMTQGSRLMVIDENHIIAGIKESQTLNKMTEVLSENSN